MALPTGLLDDVKNYLDFTWDDPEGDKKLSGIISRGILYLDRIAGTALDYTEEGLGRALLFDYARYVRANAYDEFQKNYQHELIFLQMTEAGDDTEQA